MNTRVSVCVLQLQQNSAGKPSQERKCVSVFSTVCSNTHVDADS